MCLHITPILVTTGIPSGEPHVSVSAPSDITLIGKTRIVQSFGKFDVFPKDNTQANRSFQPKWINDYPWIEYSRELDSVFCFTCRQFSTHNLVDRDISFTETGFRSWKYALERGKGFHKHDTSSNHKTCEMKMKLAQNMSYGKSIAERLNSETLQKRRYYIEAMIEIVGFLAANELAFRGDWDGNNQEESGLFNKFFDFLLMKDSFLKSCHETMPKNAKYTSPDFQNEVIDILAEQVQKSIANDINSAKYFTLLEDGTTSKKGDECICVAIRYVKAGKVFESVIAIETSKELDANAFTKITLDTLRNLGLDLSKLLSQCYDGAAVMSGHLTGVQAQIQQKLKRPIPYIHCYNHRLQLVIVKSLERISFCKDFFEQVKVIYDFFQLNNIKCIYDGKAVNSLIATRWSGHQRATESIATNYAHIISALKKVQSQEFKASSRETEQNETESVKKKMTTGEQKILGLGILNVMQSEQFCFMLMFVKKLLGILKPADKILQSRDTSLKDAIQLIDTVYIKLQELRADENYEVIKMEADSLTASLAPPQTANSEQQPTPRPIRNKRRSTRVNSNYVVMETLGERDPIQIALKSTFNDTIDTVCTELETRFQNNNDILIAISDAHKMNLELLKPLTKLNLIMPKPSELEIAADYIKKKTFEAKSKQEDFNFLYELYKIREAFPDTYNLYAAIETFACSSSICESSFSALARIGWGNRLSMTNHRLRQLTLLAFEKKRLQELSKVDVLTAFNAAKNRKVQLF